jgi:hypothetical protein
MLQQKTWNFDSRSHINFYICEDVFGGHLIYNVGSEATFSFGDGLLSEDGLELTV